MQYFILIFMFAFSVWAAPYRIIDIDEVKAHYNAHNALFVDAREANMYARGTIMRAMNIPIKRFKRMKKWLPVSKDASILIFCNGVKCGKSVKLAEKFAKAGYAQLMVYREGYPEWKKHRLPIMSAPKPCRCDDNSYIPTGEPITVQGVKLFLSKDDQSRVDARWLVHSLKQQKLPSNVQLVDVRPADQYAEGHIGGAVNVPYDPDKKSIDVDRLPKKKAIIFYCNHGSISAEAYDSLSQDISRRVKVLEADLICKKGYCTLIPN